MSCSSVGGVGQNPYQFLQQSQSTQATSDDSSTDDSSDALLQLQLQQLQQQQQAGAAPHGHHHGGHHHGGGGVGDVMNTVEQALSSASSTDDPNKVIEDTITQLLSGNGTSSTSTCTSGTTATDPTAASQSPTKQSFADFLKAHGVDMDQFRADLTAAVKNAQNGQVNAATAFKSFPPGSAVDVVA